VKAAALLESGAGFHPLIDGNKRTAWTLMVLLLWINGYRHVFTTDEDFDLVVGIAAGTIRLAGFCRSDLQASGAPVVLPRPRKGVVDNAHTFRRSGEL
jgi:prophage maintenance system killer protein